MPKAYKHDLFLQFVLILKTFLLIMNFFTISLGNNLEVFSFKTITLFGTFRYIYIYFNAAIKDDT